MRKLFTCFTSMRMNINVYQLFGGDAEGLKRAADFIQTNTKADIVDINMGCPVNKVVKNEAGAKWLTIQIRFTTLSRK